MKLKLQEPEFDGFEFGVDIAPSWFDTVPAKHTVSPETKAYLTTSMWVIPKRGNWFVLRPDGLVDFFENGNHLSVKYKTKV